MKLKSFKSAFYALMLAVLTFAGCKKSITAVEEEGIEKKRIASIASVAVVTSTPGYELIWADEFNSSGDFDVTKWSYSPRGTSGTSKYFTSSPNYASLDGNNLVVRMDNAVIAGDPVPYHSGGVRSMGKFSMTYGKVEVRAKLKEGQGSFPAIWMMPEPATQYAGSPGGGEIDIMEHISNENIVYQTIHNSVVTNANGASSASHQASYVKNDYNIYAIEWSPTSIKFFVNNSLQYTYNKTAGADWHQWPFDVPFYMILNQSGGVGWPGPITDSNLPFTMHVDYVRVYKLPLLSNGGFENATLPPWGAYQPVGGGTATAVTGDVVSGTKAIRLLGGVTSVEQVVSGLLPNTTYTFGGYAKTTAAGNATMGVKNYGAATVSSAILSSAYQQYQITFTTGATNTAATVYFYKNSTSATAFGDSFYVEKQ